VRFEGLVGEIEAHQPTGLVDEPQSNQPQWLIDKVGIHLREQPVESFIQSCRAIRRGVVNCGISGMLLRRIRPSYWSNSSGSGLGLIFFPIISMSTSHNMSNYTKNRNIISSILSTND
jgi:hypothetical protein